MKSPDEITHRPADRILKIVSELQDELAQSEAEYQLRLQEVAQETEARVRSSLAEQHERALKEAEDTARREAQQKLLAQFEVEIARLNSDSERRVRVAVAKAEADSEAKLEQHERALNEAKDTAPREAQQKLLAQFEAEIAKLNADAEHRLREAVAKAEADSEAKLEQHERALNEAKDAARGEAQQKLLAQFEAEIAKLNTDAERRVRVAVAKAEADSEAKLEQHERALNEAKDAARGEARQKLLAQFEAEIAKLNADAERRVNEAVVTAEADSKAKFEQHEKALKEAKDAARGEAQQKLLGQFEVEIAKLNADAERRVSEAVAKAEADSKAKLEQHERALNEAKDAARGEAQQKLLAQFEVEIAKLNTVAERRMREAVAKAEADSEAKLHQAVTDAKKAVRTEATHEVTSQFESKLAELGKTKDELDRKFQQAASEWNAEREKLQASAKAAVQHRPPVAASTKDRHPEVAAAVRVEISRMEAAIQEINAKLDDPKVELAAEIRLNRERAELAAYLKGLRYSIGEVSV